MPAYNQKNSGGKNDYMHAWHISTTAMIFSGAFVRK